MFYPNVNVFHIMIDLQTILTYLTLISIPIGVIYHIMTLNNTRKNQELTLKSQQLATETRQAQLFMQIYGFYDNKEFLKDYGSISTKYVYKDPKDWWEKYSSEVDIEAFSSWLRVGRFFDGVGILLNRNLIEREIIYELLGDVIQGSWEGTSEETGMGNWLQGTRDLYDRPNLWKNYEKLYNDYMKWLKQ